MFALVLALAATVALVPAAPSEYTVWSSVLFSRSGERTPEFLGDVPTTMTSVGAGAQYASGQYFRNRYLTSSGSSDGLGSAPIRGINPDVAQADQLYVLASDYQWTIASAQAFLQGLYPPFSPGTDNITGNWTATAAALDPTNVLANGTYLASPLGNYQYPQITTAGPTDPIYLSVAGSLYCPAWDLAADEYAATRAFYATEERSQYVYDKLGPPFLGGVLAEDEWGYENAYAIYDYLSYQFEHNNTVRTLVNSSSYIDPQTDYTYLQDAQFYSDQQQFAQLANLDAINPVTDEPMPNGITGSISTIAGNTLAARIMAQLEGAIATRGEYYKLNLLVGDFEPLVSLFALLQLPEYNSQFYGLPSFSSVAAWELFSYTHPADPGFPDVSDLWVRFYFSNGSVPISDFWSYGMFGLSPSAADMPWTDFSVTMASLMLADYEDWCAQCGASAVFCSALDSPSSGAPPSASSSSHTAPALTPVAAGVVGAVVALALAALLLAALMLLAGLRFHRRPVPLGGFKGSRKLASDRDLTLPKAGVIVGASVVDPSSPDAAHERVGSWELKAPSGLPPTDRGPSFDDDGVEEDVGAGPWKAVEVGERV